MACQLYVYTHKGVYLTEKSWKTQNQKNMFENFMLTSLFLTISIKKMYRLSKLTLHFFQYKNIHKMPNIYLIIKSRTIYLYNDFNI